MVGMPGLDQRPQRIAMSLLPPPIIRATSPAMAARRPIHAGRAAPASRVQFVVNFEEGGENSILHGDAASEAFLSDVLGAAPWPGQRHMNVESMFEYGSRAGFWRLWRLFTARNMPVTVFGVATALARNPQIVAAMREADWEIACHGLKWIDYKDFSDAEEAAHMREAIRLHTEATGERPLGWYTGRSSRAHAQARARRRRLSLFVGFLCRRSALLGQRPESAAPDHSLHARCQRHALHQPAGLYQRRRFLRLSARQLRLSLRRRRARAEDDVDRPALPSRRPSRPRRRARCAFSITSPASIGSGSRRGSTSPAIGTASISLAAAAPSSRGA